MKIFKNIILAAGLVVASFGVSSCDLGLFGPEVKHGEGDAVVGFASPTYTFKESAGIVRVPVAITGTPDTYPSTFDVTAEAIDLVNLNNLGDLVLFTQTTNFKDNGNGTIYVEFKIKDDTEINDDRSFKLKLTNVQGAKLSEVAETVVIIKDNDNNPYEKLWGDWVFHATSSAGAAVEFNVNISGGFTEEEVEANADKVLVCWGLAGYQWDGGIPVWYMSYDADAERLAIQAGKKCCEPGDINWGLGGNQYAVSAYWDMAASTVSETVDIPGSWSKDLNTITFDPTAGLTFKIYSDSGYTGYVWVRYYAMSMTRK